MIITLLGTLGRWILRARRWAIAKRHAAGPMLIPVVSAVIFTLLLWRVQGQGFTVSSALLFIVWALYSFARPHLESGGLLASCLILLILSLSITSQFTIRFSSVTGLSIGGLSHFLFALLFGVLFFALLGLKNRVVIHRGAWYVVLFSGLTYGATLLFSVSTQTHLGIGGGALFFCITALLAREYCRFYGRESTRLLTVSSVLIGLLALQVAWVTQLLPLTPGNTASVNAVVIIVTIMALDRYLRGTLTARFIRLSFITVGAIAVVIIIATRWQL